MDATLPIHYWLEGVLFCKYWLWVCSTKGSVWQKNAQFFFVLATYWQIKLADFVVYTILAKLKVVLITALTFVKMGPPINEISFDYSFWPPSPLLPLVSFFHYIFNTPFPLEETYFMDGPNCIRVLIHTYIFIASSPKSISLLFSKL